MEIDQAERFVEPVVRTASGEVRGARTAEIMTFIGVPYAAPPVGEFRFATPHPVMPWEGVRDTRTAGPSAPQRVATLRALDLPPIVGDGWTRGDDFLTLNVWAPAEPLDYPATSKRPVMVWVHGGGLVLGTKDAPIYDGSGFARSGVVTVAMNYRLGVEGFLPIPGAPTNLGLRDVIAALAWVRDNIEAFGGDPDNVTLFGESAGGMVVSCLLSSPLTKGLIRRAIVQSGHGSSVYPMEIARRAVDKIADHLGVTPDIDGFRSASQEQTLDALARAARPGALDLRDERGFDPNFGLQIINPVYGDDVLPAHPLAAVAAGAGADVDLLVGTTAEEANFWFATTPLRLLPKSALRWLLRRVNTQADAIIDAYAAELPGRSGAALLAAALTDLAFRWPARQFAAAHRGRTHVFEFGWRSPAVRGRLGAAHGLDLAFVFDTLAVASGPRGIAGEQPPQDLADHVHGLWMRFATDGTLPWEEFGDSRQVYQLAERAARHEPTMTAAEFLPTVMDWNP